MQDALLCRLHCTWRLCALQMGANRSGVQRRSYVPAGVGIHLDLDPRGHEDEGQLHHDGVCGKACLCAAPHCNAMVACNLLNAEWVDQELIQSIWPYVLTANMQSHNTLSDSTSALLTG